METSANNFLIGHFIQKILARILDLRLSRWSMDFMRCTFKFRFALKKQTLVLGKRRCKNAARNTIDPEKPKAG